MNATREISNEMDYKNKFVKKDNTMKYRQDKYSQFVMSPEQKRQMELMEIVNKRENDYKRTLENKEILNKQIQHAINDERSRILGKQLQEKSLEREK